MKRAFLKFAGIATRILSSVFWILIIFGFNSSDIAVMTVAAAVLHECGHLFLLIFTKNFIGFPKFVLSGFRISAPPTMRYRDEIAVAAAGPLINILAAALLFSFGGEYATLFGIMNILTAASNLLPISGYDGYRVLYAILSEFEVRCKDRLLRALSLLFVSILTFLSLYFIMRKGEGYWVFAVFGSSLMISLFRGLNSVEKVDSATKK